MSSRDVTRTEGNTFPSTQKAENEPSKFKTLGFAVLIIFGIGGLAVAGVGTGGLLQAGSLTNLGQVNSIIMIVIGGMGGISLIVIGIVGFVNTCSSSNSRGNDKSTIQDTKRFSLKSEGKKKAEKRGGLQKEGGAGKATQQSELERREVEERKRAEELAASRHREEQERKNRVQQSLSSNSASLGKGGANPTNLQTNPNSTKHPSPSSDPSKITSTSHLDCFKKNDPPHLKHIGEMAVIKLIPMDHKGVPVRMMVIGVLLDKILHLDESEYMKYVTTLTKCMEMLQRFDQNLVFSVAFSFREKEVSLVGQEKKCQAFAETMFTHFVGKYIGGQIQTDGSQKINLLSVLYAYFPFQEIVREWVNKVIPLISPDTIAAQLSAENSEEAKQKLDMLMNQSAAWILNIDTFQLERLKSTPLVKIWETLSTCDY